MYNPHGKRLFDITLSLLALILLSPVLATTAVLVRIKLGSPVIFKQARPGRYGKIFTLYKFRTMTDKKDAQGNLLPDADRLPKFGRTLRSTSLDELPELINIIRGDMSVVGPRPLLPQYLPLYSKEQARRHDVRPGLTGHAQVNGRNAITWEQKFALDCWYVDNISLVRDIKIIVKTAMKVLARNGINPGQSATVDAFTGTKGD